MENYHDGRYLSPSSQVDLLPLVTLLTDVSYIIQHEKDADTILICHGSM